MAPRNLSNSPTKIKHVIVRWIALLIMEDDGCSFIFAEVPNPNIIKVVTTSTCIIHPPNQVIGPLIRTKNRCPIKEAN